MPNRDSNHSHIRPHNYKLIRQLKRELRMSHRATASLEVELARVVSELKAALHTNIDLHAQSDALSDQLATIRQLNDRLRADRDDQLRLAQELREQLAFRESQFKKLGQEFDIKVDALDRAQSRHQEQLDKLITVADTLARLS